MSPRPPLALALALLSSPCLAQAPAPHAIPGEEAIAPYAVSDANAGASPMTDTRTLEAFHGEAGVKRVVAETLALSKADPRTAAIFAATDMVRLNRTLTEQLCYVLGGGGRYTGRTMADAHKDMGLQSADMNILVAHMQVAMDHERVPFAAQNRLLAKLAPMKRVMVER